ncbi:hypothetical protein E2C01_074407 [Portunus trituberculatus]|uniref:Uncharacterized protein n=1 Tax=Portunus trituberculatus TaxID=210409 RepID=A0A5B7IH61_PORTR|nr:hypothetical protein [Portunus trituberculatus]
MSKKVERGGKYRKRTVEQERKLKTKLGVHSGYSGHPLSRCEPRSGKVGIQGCRQREGGSGVGMGEGVVELARYRVRKRRILVPLTDRTLVGSLFYCR